MKFEVIASDNFKKEAKKLVKKYPSLKAEIGQLGEQLSETPEIGTPLGNHVFKIRLAIASKGAGKSGGARVITYVHVSETAVLLLSIYDKSNKATITDKEIKELLKRYV